MAPCLALDLEAVNEAVPFFHGGMLKAAQEVKGILARFQLVSQSDLVKAGFHLLGIEVQMVPNRDALASPEDFLGCWRALRARIRATKGFPSLPEDRT